MKEKEEREGGSKRNDVPSVTIFCFQKPCVFDPFFLREQKEKVSKSEEKSIKRDTVEFCGQEVRDSNPKSSSR